jgi:hypothetical protein
MRAHRVAVGMFAAVALAAGYLLLPSQDEALALLQRQGDDVATHAKLQNMYAAGDRRRWVIVQLALAKGRIGQAAAGSDLLDGYLAQVETIDARTLGELTELARRGNRRSTWVRAQHRLMRIAPTRDGVQKLLGQYRLLSDAAGELAVLENARLQPYFGTYDLERLASLLTAAGRSTEAIALLTRAESAPNNRWTVGRLLLFSLLIERGDFAEAQGRALKWIKQLDADWIAVELVRRAVTVAPDDFAQAFTEEAIKARPSMQMSIAAMLLNEGKRELARGLITRFASAAATGPIPSQVELQNYVAAARMLNETTAPFQLLLAYVKRPAAQEQAAALAEMISGVYGPMALEPVRDALDFELLEHRPVFAAELAVHDGNAEIARQYLDRCDPATLTTDERRRWLELFMRLQPPGRVMATVEMLRRNGLLEREMLPSVASYNPVL